MTAPILTLPIDLSRVVELDPDDDGFTIDLVSPTVYIVGQYVGSEDESVITILVRGTVKITAEKPMY